jgi:hypothetical protein
MTHNFLQSNSLLSPLNIYLFVQNFNRMLQNNHHLSWTMADDQNPNENARTYGRDATKAT